MFSEGATAAARGPARHWLSGEPPVEMQGRRRLTPFLSLSLPAPIRPFLSQGDRDEAQEQERERREMVPGGFFHFGARRLFQQPLESGEGTAVTPSRVAFPLAVSWASD